MSSPMEWIMSVAYPVRKVMTAGRSVLLLGVYTTSLRSSHRRIIGSVRHAVIGLGLPGLATSPVQDGWYRASGLLVPSSVSCLPEQGV